MGIFVEKLQLIFLFVHKIGIFVDNPRAYIRKKHSVSAVLSCSGTQD